MGYFEKDIDTCITFCNATQQWRNDHLLMIKEEVNRLCSDILYYSSYLLLHTKYSLWSLHFPDIILANQLLQNQSYKEIV